MPSLHPHQSSLGMANYTHHSTPPRSFVPAASQFASVRPAAGGHKRSRDEASENLEPDVKILPVEKPEEEWVYGPGMTLIKSSTQYLVDAGSQSGTWLEEKKASDAAAIQEARSLIRNPKLQRTESTVPAAPAANGPFPLSLDIETSSNNATQGLIIDSFTLHLGIGWHKISEDEHIQAAARGWARFIENHFPVSNARIMLESKGLESYLVESDQGFFLFAENLRQGQLVSQTAEGALQNLQCSPPHFDGMETLTAAESPLPTGERSAGSLVDMEMNMD